jgi:hypothetical protein
MKNGPDSMCCTRFCRRHVLAASIAVAAFGVATVMQGCATALQPAASGAAVLYAEGARQDTAMLEISMPAQAVYESLLRVVAQRSDLELVNKNEDRLLIEVARGEMNLAAQATTLSDGRTLLFLWTDAGNSGQSGQDLARTAIEQICTELAVECEVREY